jgi:2'-5' RNA ligase
VSKVVDELKVRTFVAVDVSDEVRRACLSLYDDFSPHVSLLRWVDPQRLHITLRFLGEIPASRVADVTTAARAAASRSAPFSLHVSQIGAFPNVRSPRVLWVGLAQDQGLAALRRLVADLEKNLVEMRFATESKPFSPHLTVARVREHVNGSQRQTLGEAVRAASHRHHFGQRFDVREVRVMRSELGRGGPAYSVLERAPLG